MGRIWLTSCRWIGHKKARHVVNCELPEDIDFSSLRELFFISLLSQEDDDASIILYGEIVLH